MPTNWLMDKEDVVYIYNGILLVNEKEWNHAICNKVDGTGGYYAGSNKSVRERQISYVFTHMWILGHLIEDHGGREGGKSSYKQRGKEANHKRLLNTENKLKAEWGGRRRRGEDGWWALRKELVGMNTGCCIQAMNHGNLPPKPRAHCKHCMLSNLTINYILKNE